MAYAGGWKSTATMLECYQHADTNTRYKVVSSPAQVRERQALYRALQSS